MDGFSLYHGRKEELMANQSAINNIYNYYLTTYAPKTDSKFDTHKKSELRGVYNSIVKMNKEAPLFIVDKSQETKEYAVGLKENARAFRNTIVSLGGVTDEEMLGKKSAFSSNDSLASVKFIGENEDAANAPAFDLKVKKLATPQENTGKMLPSNSIYLPKDTYSFDIGINGLNYEFQYMVNDKDTNRSVQEKLARLITNADIGLKADVINGADNTSALHIESVNTGVTSTGGHMFEVTDDNTSRTKGSVAYFGLNNVTKESSNSQFVINGVDAEASSNIFTVEKKFEVHINRESKDDTDTANIRLKANVDSVAENINTLVDAYNNFVDVAGNYSSNHPKSSRLVDEMASLVTLHENELSEVGVELQEDGHISLDRVKLSDAVEEKKLGAYINDLKHFAGSVLRKVDQVSLNPMKYAERTLVAYKNPGHNYATPYVTSAYTGMMFNGYC